MKSHLIFLFACVLSSCRTSVMPIIQEVSQNSYTISYVNKRNVNIGKRNLVKFKTDADCTYENSLEDLGNVTLYEFDGKKYTEYLVDLSGFSGKSGSGGTVRGVISGFHSLAKFSECAAVGSNFSCQRSEVEILDIGRPHPICKRKYGPDYLENMIFVVLYGIKKSQELISKLEPSLNLNSLEILLLPKLEKEVVGVAGGRSGVVADNAFWSNISRVRGVGSISILPSSNSKQIFGLMVPVLSHEYGHGVFKAICDNCYLRKRAGFKNQALEYQNDFEEPDFQINYFGGYRPEVSSSVVISAFSEFFADYLAYLSHDNRPTSPYGILFLPGRDVSKEDDVFSSKMLNVFLSPGNVSVTRVIGKKFSNYRDVHVIGAAVAHFMYEMSRLKLGVGVDEVRLPEVELKMMRFAVDWLKIVNQHVIEWRKSSSRELLEKMLYELFQVTTKGGANDAQCKAAARLVPVFYPAWRSSGKISC